MRRGDKALAERKTGYNEELIRTIERIEVATKSMGKTEQTKSNK